MSKTRKYKKDPLIALRACLKRYHEHEHEIISTNPKLIETDLENLSDSYRWLRLPMIDDQQETLLNMIDSGVEDFPAICLSGILGAVLKNRVPKLLGLTGMSIDNRKTQLRFCISGSISLEDLRTLCEQYRQKPCLED